MNEYPTVSVIINTDGRAELLGNVLGSLRYLRYPRFEVVVVPGPTADGTYELLENWRGRVKIGHCPVRNISRSRNIGVQISSGEFVAYVDDDEVPEPEWLEDLMPALADPAVAAAGGFLHNHTGKGYQSRFETVNRLGHPDNSWERPTPEFNFPLSYNFPHVMINNPFRRSAIIDVGGFDEEYEYYLDETDLICRMVDRGWRMAQIAGGYVHHKFMPSRIRNEHRMLTSWYTVLKNRMYFALMNGGNFVTVSRVFLHVEGFLDGFRADVARAIRQGILTQGDAERLEREADQALRDGLARGLRGTRRLPDARALAGDVGGFLPFPTHLPAAEQRCLIIVSADYDAADCRPDRELAGTIAAEGHQVHVVTRGEGHDRVDFEDCVWVHRCVEQSYPPPPAAAGSPLPADLWNRSMTLLAEAKEIAARRLVDCVRAPIEDLAAIAFLHDGTLPLVTSLRSGSRPGADPAAERVLLAGSDAVLADSAAFARIEAAHGLRIEPGRLCLVRDGPDGRTAQEAALLLQFARRWSRRRSNPAMLELAASGNGQ
jgi:glycogen(starch) synthase